MGEENWKGKYKDEHMGQVKDSLESEVGEEYESKWSKDISVSTSHQHTKAQPVLGSRYFGRRSNLSNYYRQFVLPLLVKLTKK